MNLYELTAGYADIMKAAEEGEDVSALLTTLEDSIEAKGAGIARVLANLEADAEAFGAEEKRLGAKRKAREAQIEHLRGYVKACLTQAQLTSIRGGSFSITIAAGKERVEVDDMAALEAAAPELVRTSVAKAADKTAVLARYKQQGECLPGVRIEPTTTLRIR